MRKSWLRQAFDTAALVLSLITATSAPANAVSTGWIESYYMLVNSYTNQCMEVNSPTAGSIVQQWPCWGGDNQRWLWKYYYDPSNQSIRVRSTGYCLSNSGGRELQSPCVQPGYHQWFYQVGLGGGTGLYEIRDLTYGNCLEVQGMSTYNGAPVVLARCNGGPHQRWRMA